MPQYVRVHSHRQQSPIRLKWLINFGLSVFKTVSGTAGNKMPISAINPDAQDYLEALLKSFAFYSRSHSDVPLDLHQCNPFPPSTLCYIITSLLLLSSSQGTFLGDQTQLRDLSLARWQRRASCQYPRTPPPPPPVCLVFRNGASSVCCMLTMAWSGLCLRGCVVAC